VPIFGGCFREWYESQSRQGQHNEQVRRERKASVAGRQAGGDAIRVAPVHG